MSTQVINPHQHRLDPSSRILPPLPPPRPSSNLSNGFYQNIPQRPSSNVSNHQFAPPPPRTHSGMSNGGGGYSHSHPHGSQQPQARAGAEYSSYANGLTHQSSHDDLRRTNSAASHRQRAAASQSSHPPPHAQAEAAQMPSYQANDAQDDSSGHGKKRGRNSPVDWRAFFGGKAPAEIITIHDDDSPVPPENSRRLPPPTNGASTSRHADKKRRTNATGADAQYSNTHTPYYSNGTSTESLQNTTAPTSLGSQASRDSRLDGAQTGQKRKRTGAGRSSDQDRKRQETERSGPRGYLAEYGEYVPPPKQLKKQKEVNVPPVQEV